MLGHIRKSLSGMDKNSLMRLGVFSFRFADVFKD